MYLVFSAFISRQSSILTSSLTSAFVFVVIIFPPNGLTSEQKADADVFPLVPVSKSSSMVPEKSSVLKILRKD
jgi:hypothetical protein